MRFRQRKKVVFPQPEGPMSAVACRSARPNEMGLSACTRPPVIEAQLLRFGFQAGCGLDLRRHSLPVNSSSKTRSYHDSHTVHGEGHDHQDDTGCSGIDVKLVLWT